MFSRSMNLLVLVGIFAFVVIPHLAQTPEPQRDNRARGSVWAFDEASYLGVQTVEVNRANFASFGLREVRGVAVEKVMDGSPAQAGGLQEGDVIVRFNGQEVGSSRMLMRLVNEVGPDHTARITVIRGGTERELNITVGKRPTPRFQDGMFNFKFPDGFPHVEIPNIQIPSIPPMPKIDVMPHIEVIPNIPDFDHNLVWSFPRRQIGISSIRMTKQMAESFGVTDGVMISEVREGSPAAKAGLKAGDVIVEVDGRAVRGDGDLIRSIGEKKEGDVTLTIVRDRKHQSIKVTPEEPKDGFHPFGVPGPKAPGTMNIVKPNNRMDAPTPLNNLFIPGRVI